MAQHKRKDSGVARMPGTIEDDTNDQGGKAVEHLRAFLDAARNLSTHDGSKHLEHLLNIEKEHEEQRVRHARILQRREQQVDDLTIMNEDNKRKIKELEATCATLNTVKAERAEALLRVDQLVSELQAEDSFKREQAAKVEALQKELETSKFEAERWREDFSRQETRAKQAEREAEWLQKYRARLQPEDEAATVSRLKELWTYMHSFAKKYFHVDLPESVLNDESAWARLRCSRQNLPLPRRNSPAAKNMRFAAVLNLIIDKVMEHIFHHNYVLTEDGDIWEALLQQAKTEVHQERAFRSALLAILPEEQENAAHLSKANVQDQVWHVLSSLVENDQRVAEDLEKCVQKSLEFWNATKQLETFYFFSFEPWFNDDDEPSLRIPGEDVGKGKAAVTSSPNQAVAPEGKVVLTVFPHMNTFEKRVLAGRVLREHQIQAAEEELQAEEKPDRSLRRQNTLRGKNPALIHRS